MSELSKKAGLPIGLGPDGKLSFGEGMGFAVENARRLEGMRPVLMDGSADGPADTYYMYRDVCRAEDKEKIRAAGLRFDLTVMPACRLGDEFNKTFGHSHPLASGKLTYPEVYEVVQGKAHCALQNREEFVVVEAGEGDKVVIPPGYTHFTINPGPETLVMANWVERTFSSEYNEVKEKRGAAWYETVRGWKKNRKYASSPPLKFAEPVEWDVFGLGKGTPMYVSGLRDLGKLSFLKDPLPHQELLKNCWKEKKTN